jgi:hypothetical protein
MATNDSKAIGASDVGRSDKAIVLGAPQGVAYAVAATTANEAGVTLAEWHVRYMALRGTVHTIAQCTRSDATWFASHPAGPKGQRRGTLHRFAHVEATKGQRIACMGGHDGAGASCDVTTKNVGDGLLRVRNIANAHGGHEVPTFDGNNAATMRAAREWYADVLKALGRFGVARLAATPSIAQGAANGLAPAPKVSAAPRRTPSKASKAEPSN